MSDTANVTRWAMVVMPLLLWAAGCGPRYWYHESRTFEQCRDDYYACLEELEGYSDQTALGEYELNFLDDCMKQRGYKLVAENRLPLRARRLRPDQTIHYRLRGLAGTVPQDQE
jgi:hypothetical protein